MLDTGTHTFTLDDAVDDGLDFTFATIARPAPVVVRGGTRPPLMRLGARDEKVCTPYPDGRRVRHAGVFEGNTCLLCGGAR